MSSLLHAHIITRAPGGVGGDVHLIVPAAPTSTLRWLALAALARAHGREGTATPATVSCAHTGAIYPPTWSVAQLLAALPPGPSGAAPCARVEVAAASGALEVPAVGLRGLLPQPGPAFDLALRTHEQQLAARSAGPVPPAVAAAALAGPLQRVTSQRTLWASCAFNASPAARASAVLVADSAKAASAVALSSAAAHAASHFAGVMSSQLSKVTTLFDSLGPDASPATTEHHVKAAWPFVRIKSLVHDLEGNGPRFRALFVTHFAPIVDVFRHYAVEAAAQPVAEGLGGTGGGGANRTMQFLHAQMSTAVPSEGSVSLTGFVALCARLGLMPPLPRTSLESIFYNTNADRRRDRSYGGDDCNDASLSLFEFFEALAFLAEGVFGMEYNALNERASLFECLEKLCVERIVPLSRELGYGFARTVLRSEGVQTCIASRLSALEAVHALYSVTLQEPKRRARLVMALSAQLEMTRKGDVGGALKSAAAGPPILFSPVKRPGRSIGRVGKPMLSLPVSLQRPGVDTSAIIASPGSPALATSEAESGITGGLVTPACFLELLAHAGLLSDDAAEGGVVDIAPILAELSGKKQQNFLRSNTLTPVLYPGAGALSRREALRSFWGAAEVQFPGEPTPLGLTPTQLLEAIGRAGLAKWGPVAGLNFGWVGELGALERDALRIALGRDRAFRVFARAGGASVDSIASATVSDAPVAAGTAASSPSAAILPCPAEVAAAVASVVVNWALTAVADVASHLGAPLSPEALLKVRSLDAGTLALEALASPSGVPDHALMRPVACPLAAIDPESATLPEARARAWKVRAALPLSILSHM